MAEEWFEVVDEDGHVRGRALRSECHGNPDLIHQSVHVVVFDRDGRLLLQKRSAHKDTQPGKWDTSVGGHVQPGEKPEAAAARETREELGVPPLRIDFAYQYLWRSAFESELVRTYATLFEGPFQPNPEEIDEARFWSVPEIKARLPDSLFTPQFIEEFPRMLDFWKRKQASMTHFTR